MTPSEFVLQIDARGVLVREALTRKLTFDEECAIAELVESLRDLLGEDSSQDDS